MNYFVTDDGYRVADNLTKNQAIERAKKEWDKPQSTHRIGIGHKWRKKGEIVYSLVPMHFYLP